MQPATTSDLQQEACDVVDLVIPVENARQDDDIDDLPVTVEVPAASGTLLFTFHG